VILHNSEKRGESVVQDPFREKTEDLISGWDLVYVTIGKREVHLDQ